MNNKRIFQVDAFTDEAFKGNPAGVMIVDSSITTEWMQNMAFEMNLSETAFLIQNKTGYQIRFFTPTREIPICGHATLASAHIIYELNLISKQQKICFSSKAGELVVSTKSNWIIMDFPKYPLMRIGTHKNFKKTIGFDPIEVYKSDYDWVIAIAANENDIYDAQPNFELMKTNGLGHLMITAKGNSEKTDFIVRCFAPISGINEDPVTGSAHCALTPLWAKKLDKTDMDSLQVSNRTGKLKVKLINDRVEIKGRAITIFDATLKI